MQLSHFTVIPRFGRFDGFLCQVVTQHVQRVHRMHALTPPFRIGRFTLAAGQVVRPPGIETGQVDEVVTHHLQRLGDGLIAQLAEEQVVVHTTALHALHQALHQRHVVLFRGGQAQTPAHQVQVVCLVQRQEQAQRLLERFDFDHRGQRLGQRTQVPVGDRDLVGVTVAATVVGVVADEVGVEIVEEGVRAEVEGDAEDRHVVGVHHPMAEAIGLPQGDQLCIALDDGAEHGQIRLHGIAAFGVVLLQHMVDQHALLFRLPGVVEVFEMPETHMALRQAGEHRRAFAGFAPHRGAGADHAQCPAAGNAQGVQGLGSEELADRGAQHGAAVAHARIGRLSGALEVQVPVLALVIQHFGQQQAAAITQAWVIGAELMAGIDHSPRVGLFPQLLATEQLGENRQLCLGRVEVEQRHGRLARYHQARV